MRPSGNKGFIAGVVSQWSSFAEDASVFRNWVHVSSTRLKRLFLLLFWWEDRLSKIYIDVLIL